MNWELFRFQVLQAVGLWGHPRADEAYSLAWKNGHEGGKDEILCHLWDIAEMILEDR